MTSKSKPLTLCYISGANIWINSYFDSYDHSYGDHMLNPYESLILCVLNWCAKANKHLWLSSDHRQWPSTMLVEFFIQPLNLLQTDGCNLVSDGNERSSFILGDKFHLGYYISWGPKSLIFWRVESWSMVHIISGVVYLLTFTLVC